PKGRRGDDSIVVHVNAQRGGGRVLREQTRFARHLRERHALPAELLRNSHLEIPGGLQLVEILQTKCVIAIVFGRALAAPVKKRLGQYGTRSRSHEFSLEDADGASRIDARPNIRQDKIVGLSAERLNKIRFSSAESRDGSVESAGALGETFWDCRAGDFISFLKSVFIRITCHAVAHDTLN